MNSICALRAQGSYRRDFECEPRSGTRSPPMDLARCMRQRVIDAESHEGVIRRGSITCAAARGKTGSLRGTIAFRRLTYRVRGDPDAALSGSYLKSHRFCRGDIYSRHGSAASCMLGLGLREHDHSTFLYFPRKVGISWTRRGSNYWNSRAPLQPLCRRIASRRLDGPRP
jgi:hypothetical protein